MLCLVSPSAGVDVSGMGQSAVSEPGHRGGLCLVFSTLADGSGLSGRSTVSFPSELRDVQVLSTLHKTDCL